RFMAPGKDSQTAEAGRILSEATRARLYWYLSLAYIVGAFISFAAQYFSGRATLNSALLFSTLMLILGLALEAIQKIKIGNGYRDVLSDILMSVTIPLMIIKYIDSAAVYTLTVPVLFVLISVAFNQKRMLVLTGTMTLATLLFLLIIQPIQSFTFDYTDHLVRIFIFIMMIWIAYLINQIYRKRLAQYDEQVKQQELIAEISADFVSADEHNIDYKIKRLLKKCGEYFLSDHVYIIFFDNINKEVNLLYEWRKTGIKSVAELIENAEEDNLPVWLNKDPHAEQRIYITKVEELEESRIEKCWLKDQQINLVLTMLLMEKEEVVGFLGFHTVNEQKLLEYSTQNMIQMIGNHVTHALLKVAAEKELNHMAYFDNLTGAPNRLLFNKRLEDAMEQALKTNRLVGLIYLDLDLFKTVNDIMGHDAGDTFLKQVAQNLSFCLSDDDTLARFGGDEFLIFIPQAVHSDEIIHTANRIIEMFGQPIQVEKHQFSVTASMGISFFPIDGDSPEELVRNADLAMYRSKEYGKNRYTVCSEQLKEEFRLKTELKNSLYHALERDELELYYQPKVKSNGEIIGVEALVRWNHPKRGLILPDEFIPIAESIGLISSIDQWVVQKACWQCKAWQDMGFLKIKMAFNLSPAQFYRESFINSIENALKENELEPELLEVEITESIAYYRPETFTKILDKLKTLGLSVAIDDFGTDYSSLSRLRSLPIDRIKIDKQFTDEIPHNKKQGDIVKAILALGRILGLKVTVEGVETEQQFEFFKENTCDEIQGYYFYKPMPANEIEAVLK
ncbi:MAG TPA: EAL domain-containing protein, partial [Anaerovoracaceae bacterium]|nr:EAL domain-containing protein [Anaerovoracaceae bacterium]